jgi:hypothetical protein
MNHSEPASLRQRYQRQFVRHLRAPRADAPPEGVSAERIGVYVELLYNKIEDSLLACFPMTRELLGPEPWHRLVRGFIARHRCVSPCYRQIPDEFIDYLRSERAEPGDPPLWIELARYDWIELAHYEWMELVLTIAEEESVTGAFDPGGDMLKGVPVFAPVITLLQYRYPVHRLAPAPVRESGDMAPGATPFFILGFRDTGDAVRFIEVSAATARLIALLQESGGSGKEALTRLAAEMRHPDCGALISFGAEILRNLALQGAILGTKHPESRPNSE